MGKYIKKHKIKTITGFAIFVVVPIGIKHISMIPGFSSTSNDWVGFWGSYLQLNFMNIIQPVSVLSKNRMHA